MPLRVFEGFAGYGGGSFAFRRLEELNKNYHFEVVGYSEIDKYASELFDLNHKDKNESPLRIALLNSKDYGIPQNRERVWMLACLGGLSSDFDITPPKRNNDLKLKDFFESIISAIRRNARSVFIPMRYVSLKI